LETFQSVSTDWWTDYNLPWLCTCCKRIARHTSELYTQTASVIHRHILSIHYVNNSICCITFTAHIISMYENGAMELKAEEHATVTKKTMWNSSIGAWQTFTYLVLNICKSTEAKTRKDWTAPGYKTKICTCFFKSAFGLNTTYQQIHFRTTTSIIFQSQVNTVILITWTSKHCFERIFVSEESFERVFVAKKGLEWILVSKKLLEYVISIAKREVKLPSSCTIASWYREAIVIAATFLRCENPKHATYIYIYICNYFKQTILIVWQHNHKTNTICETAVMLMTTTLNANLLICNTSNK